MSRLLYAEIGMASGALLGLIASCLINADFKDPYTDKLRRLEQNPVVQEYLSLRDSSRINEQSALSHSVVNLLSEGGLIGGLGGLTIYSLRRKKSH